MNLGIETKIFDTSSDYSSTVLNPVLVEEPKITTESVGSLDTVNRITGNEEEAQFLRTNSANLRDNGPLMPDEKQMFVSSSDIGNKGLIDDVLKPNLQPWVEKFQNSDFGRQLIEDNQNSPYYQRQQRIKQYNGYYETATKAMRAGDTDTFMSTLNEAKSHSHQEEHKPHFDRLISTLEQRVYGDYVIPEDKKESYLDTLDSFKIDENEQVTNVD
ncbi:MAG: hypothetical protein HRT47_00905 [Candidatus Caenarcaniphilales bacterium]|nr:hypothetical protein [Candidatus Caenarcaniphilales bacterium]